MAFPTHAASTLQFTTNRYSVAESGGVLILTVQREGDTSREVRVDYATADGTAVQGQKYTAVSGTLTFVAGGSRRAIEVPILNDGLVSGTKTFYGSTPVDDAGYLRSLIQETGRRFAVDRKRVYLMGHSNGGYMSYRMACDSADLIAGIASLAGMTYLDPSRCAPSEPVNILHIHGTADASGLYGGGAPSWSAPLQNYPPYPGAVQTVRTWAGYNGASDPVTDASTSLDLTLDVAGLDTVVTRYTACAPGGTVELWTINNGSHLPALSAAFSPRVIDWLLAHPKP